MNIFLPFLYLKSLVAEWRIRRAVQAELKNPTPRIRHRAHHHGIESLSDGSYDGVLPPRIPSETVLGFDDER